MYYERQIITYDNKYFYSNLKLFFKLYLPKLIVELILLSYVTSLQYFLRLTLYPFPYFISPYGCDKISNEQFFKTLLVTVKNFFARI